MGMQTTPAISGLAISSSWGRDAVVIRARWNNMPAGEIKCFVLPESVLRLDIIEVEGTVFVPRVFSWLPAKKIRMRGRGIGRLMLDELIERAKAQRVTEIRGEIPRHLHDAWPLLPQWYEKQGFLVREMGKDYSADNHDPVFEISYSIPRE